VEKKETEISGLFALVASRACSVLAAGLSLLWFNRILHAEAALLEQARGLVEDLLVLFGGFRCGVSHVTSTCSGVLQELA
jgi:hypothetical protein